MSSRNGQAWIEQLDAEDVAFIKRFLLASGSLKDVAAAYGISYPTVRTRLDRLIEKVRVLDSRRITSPFERALRVQLADGKIDATTFKTLLTAHEKELEAANEIGNKVDRGAGDGVSDYRNE